jgi:hypothetical protein
MNLQNFLAKIISTIKQLFSTIPADLQQAVHLAVLLAENLKALVDSPGVDVLTALIPGPADDVAVAALRAALPKILTELKLIDRAAALTDPSQIAVAAAKVLSDLDPGVQSAFLHSIAALAAQVAADGQLSWSDAIYLVEWFYRNRFKAN